MLSQIVCRSCVYHRDWPPLLEALADGLRHAEHPPDPVPPEAGERRCPYCRYQRLAADGPTSVAQGMVKEMLRCVVCGLRFVFVRRIA